MFIPVSALEMLTNPRVHIPAITQFIVRKHKNSLGIHLVLCKQQVGMITETNVSNLTHWDRDKMTAIFSDNIFKCIFLNENFPILIKISLKFIHESPIDIMSALVQIMAWCQTGNKLLSEPMLA